MDTSKKSKYPVAIFELIPASANGANFVREDTIGTQNPVVLVHPKNRVIMSESIISVESETEKGVHINVPTRYIYNQEIILKNKQEERGILPNPKTDKPVFINGLLTVPKNGGYVGLYNFMTTHAQNASNENVPKDLDGNAILQPIFREIKPAEDAHENNFNEFLIVEAIGYIKALVTEKNGKYIYNEERLDVLGKLFNVYSESHAQLTTALIAYAKLQPKIFLEKAKANEQTVLIEVNHGLILKVISFEGSTAVYVGKNLKIKEFPQAKTDDAKKEALANYFSTVDGKEAYELYKAELSAAKQANVSQQ